MKKNYKITVDIPKHITVQRKNQNLIISGTLGSTLINLHKYDTLGQGCINFTEDKQAVTISSFNKPFFKCVSKIITQKIADVANGFLLLIRIVGVGYKIRIHKQDLQKEKKNQKNHLSNQVLYLKIGFSHNFKYVIPSSVKIFLLEPTLICMYGVDKNQVTQVAAKIRQIKPPSIYKGKGIKLVNETLVLKQGKRK